jgi:very-short-patch-repair endonuclease
MGRLHTEESKQKISKSRKEYLNNNPDKHVWKRNKKFKSVPCEHFKQMLKKHEILYFEEYCPLSPTYFYTLDVAFPNVKVAIEINGNQHYNNDGTLKDYYLKRKEILENAGWTVIDIHYSMVYNENLMKDIISNIKNNYILSQADYEIFYIKPKEKIIHCSSCGCEKKSKKGTLCKSCSSKIYNNNTKRFIISKEDLEKLVKEKSMSEIGRMYNVSSTAISKRCKKYNIILEKYFWQNNILQKEHNEKNKRR